METRIKQLINEGFRYIDIVETMRTEYPLVSRAQVTFVYNKIIKERK